MSWPGTMIGAAIPNQAAAMQAVMFGGFLLVFMLSGLMFPLANVPVGLRWISHFVWARYYIEIVRDVFLQGEQEYSRHNFEFSDVDMLLAQFKMAEMDAELDVFQVFVDHCVAEHNAGRLNANLAAKAKMVGSELEWRMADLGLQLHGGWGYMQEYEISSIFTNARMSRIYAGSSEIMRYIIGRDVFSQKYQSILA